MHEYVNVASYLQQIVRLHQAFHLKCRPVLHQAWSETLDEVQIYSYNCECMPNGAHEEPILGSWVWNKDTHLHQVPLSASAGSEAMR
jgi:hypothetical protein